MKKRFQDISFRVSKYFRPFEPWHCGGLQNGETCLLGPDKNGCCRAVTDCEPAKANNTWQCKRSELMGGKCTTGPQAHGECGRQRTPCKPVPNIRLRHLRFGLAAFVAMLAIAISVVAFDFWRSPVSAGPLSRHHASFAAASCESCHESAKHPKKSWLVNFSRPHVQQDSNNCLNCHQMGEEPRLAHALNKTAIDAITAKINQASTISELGGASSETSIDGAHLKSVPKTSMWVGASKALFGTPQAELACSVCHQEHIGSSADITQVSNQQCAVCHINSFDSLADHPPFTNYPAERRTGIAFSHNSHLFKHFSDQKFVDMAPEGCRSCHAVDPIGRKMEVSNFEQSCSSCHQSQITGDNRASGKGIAMLSVPTLDLQALEDRGVDVGEWPVNSNAELTPLSLILVAAYDDEFAAQLPLIQQMDLYDLTDASDEELELVYQFAWRLKQTFFDIQRGGAQTLYKRLGLSNVSLSGDKLSTQPQNLLGLLSPEVVDVLVTNAFPSLQNEVAQWLQRGSPVFKLRQSKPLVSPLAETETTLSDEEEFSIDEEEEFSLDEEEEFSLDEEEEFSLDEEEEFSLDEEEEFSLDEEEEFSLDEEEEFSLDEEEEFSLDEEEEFSLDEEEEFSLDEEEEFSLDEVEQSQDNNRVLSEPASLEDRVAAGGWFFEDFYLYYRPAGHADQLIVAWLDYIVTKLDSTSALGKPMLTSFIDKKKPGSCFKCHSVESVAKPGLGNELRVNWHGAKTAANVNDFNRFKHQSHFAVVEQSGDTLSELGDRGCISCHKSNDSADSRDSYEKMDASVYQSEFEDLDKDICINCHEADPELATCTLCHNYHIGESGIIRLSDGFRSDSSTPSHDEVE